jgi:hypothetical protein
MGSEPLVTRVTVGPDPVKLSASAGSPAELELDDTAGRYQPGLDERT